MWLKDRSCEEVIREAWGDGQQPVTAWAFNKKKISCQDNLRVWNREKFGHVQYSLRKKMTNFKVAKEGGWYRSQPARIQALRDEILLLQSIEECISKQRSRNTWLKKGDKNTKFFHSRAN